MCTGAALAAVSVGCTVSAQFGPPPEDVAIATVERAVDAVTAGDRVALCDLAAAGAAWCLDRLTVDDLAAPSGLGFRIRCTVAPAADPDDPAPVRVVVVDVSGPGAPSRPTEVAVRHRETDGEVALVAVDIWSGSRWHGGGGEVVAAEPDAPDRDGSVTQSCG